MKIKDSNTRRTFETGAVRDGEESRGRFDLLPANILLRLHGIEPLDYVALRCFAIHIENGAQKYSERNWEKGIPIHVYYNSAFRHCLKLGDGDEPHCTALLWNLVCLLWTVDKINKGDLPETLWHFPFSIKELEFKPKHRSEDLLTYLLKFLEEGDCEILVSMALHVFSLVRNET